MASIDKPIPPSREPKDPQRAQRAELVRAATAEDWRSRAGSRLEKRGRDGLKLVVAKAPELILNGDGEIVGVDAWVQLFDENGRELPIDPHRRIINPPTVPRAGVRLSETGKAEAGLPVLKRTVTEDPAAAFWEAVWDSVSDAPNPQGWRTRGTVTTVYSGATDGAVVTSSSTYSNARENTGGASITAFPGAVTTGVGQNFATPTYTVYEAFVAFDLSAIPDADRKTAIQLSVWVTDDHTSTDFTLEARHRIWGPTVDTTDFVAGSAHQSFTLLASRLVAATAGAYNTLTSLPEFLSPPFLAADTLPVMLTSSRQRLGNTPTGIEAVNISLGATTGTTQDPKLVITHDSAPATVPLVTEDFEDASLNISLSGTWARSSTTAATGSWSLRSGTIGHSAATDATVSVPAGAVTVQFSYRVSSEQGFDFFRFYVGGSLQFESSGEVVWIRSPAFNVSGSSTITFRYIKDGATVSGLDAAFVDDVVFFRAAGTHPLSASRPNRIWRLG